MNDPQYVYEAPSDDELITVTFLDRLAKSLGYPTDLDTDAGMKLMDAVIGAWFKHFPQESKDWAHDVSIDLALERTPHQAGEFGYNPVGYPPTLFKLTKTMFPDMKLNQKEVWKKLIRVYPKLFKTSNYA